MHKLPVSRLTAESFAPYGEVIECGVNPFNVINASLARRYYNLAHGQRNDGGEGFYCSLMTTEPWPLDKPLKVIERHLHSTQAFIPVSNARFVVIVARPGETPTEDNLRAFVTNGEQGINYRIGTWHHPMIALAGCRFVVLDAGGSDLAYEEIEIPDLRYDLFIDPAEILQP